MRKTLIQTSSLAATLVLAGAFLTSAVRAGELEPLKTADAKTFALCLEPFNAKGESIENSGALKTVNDEMDVMKIVDGQLRIYSAPLAMLKERVPSVYAELDGVAKSCGMKSATNFATIGDRVLAAYMAINMPPEVAVQYKQMTPEMMAMLPPQARDGFAMMEALENVPDADKAALNEEIIKLLDKATANTGGSRSLIKSP